jgi:dihydroorotate dehydrogenase electron transfer subunit
MTAHQPANLGMFLATVAQRRTPCRAHFELVLSLPGFPPAVPGQFVQVLCAPPTAARHQNFTEQALSSLMPQWTPALPLGRSLLRRPFSIGGLRRHNDSSEINLLGRVIGPGSEWLATLHEGDRVDLLGPLGRGFPLPPRPAHVLLVAGGVGLPPIRWLAEVLAVNGFAGEFLYGAQSRDLIPLTLREEPNLDGTASFCAAEFASLRLSTAISTDDGSCGLCGRATDLLQRRLDRPRDADNLVVYTCGPEPMLRTAARLCAERRTACYVAMERRMGCGMGTCQSCVIRVRDSAADQGWRYALCCTDGPVFDAATVLWD